jgi:NAD-dependent deacetylase
MVLTGAGISAESGLPTFRGKEGYWRSLDPRKLATASAFRSDPVLVWEWYRERRALIRLALPNPAHRATIKLAAHAREFLLLTQNVDDLHCRAVWEQRHLPLDSIVQIHGDIFVTRCMRCEFRRGEEPADAKGLPICPQCGAILRPGVVWFDEELPQAAVQHVESFLSSGECDLVVVVGTTASFDYIVDWAVAARGKNGRLVDVNTSESTVSSLADEFIQEPAGIALPKLVEQWTQQGVR